MTKKRPTQARRFERQGFLAIEPKAFFELFMAPSERPAERIGNVDVIEISGPLVQRDEMWCDSYEAIRARVKLACEGDAQAIVLRFDSPGGDASGCFETARAIRADCAKANKPLFAYLDKACSAAYALASAATQIAIGETCCAGSIGVICSRPDYTAMNTREGLRMAFVVSGKRKLDGNPDVPITEDELVRTQGTVDELAGRFFKLISEQRPQLSAATIAGFDGGVFYGDGAVAAGLADVVTTFDELLAAASEGQPMATMQAKSDFDVARASLEKLAKGEDANAAAAREALAALTKSAAEGGEEDPPAEEPPAEDAGAETEEDATTSAEDDEDDDPDAESDAAAVAASDEPADDESKKKKAVAARGVTAEVSLAATVHRMRAEIAADKDRRVRRKLLASRPDFGPEVRASLAKAPIATLRDLVKTLPKVPRTAVKNPKAATTVVGASRGESQGVNEPGARSSEANEMDVRMGLTGQKLGCRKEGSSLVFGVVQAASKPKAAGGAA